MYMYESVFLSDRDVMNERQAILHDVLLGSATSFLEPATSLYSVQIHGKCLIVTADSLEVMVSSTLGVAQ